MKLKQQLRSKELHIERFINKKIKTILEQGAISKALT